MEDAIRNILKKLPGLVGDAVAALTGKVAPLRPCCAIVAADFPRSRNSILPPTPFRRAGRARTESGGSKHQMEHSMNKSHTFLLVAALALSGAVQAGKADGLVERGRYLLAVGGCNDCHTPGFAQRGEQIPEAERLTGMAVGFSGPWGVSYPANLRLVAAGLSESEWLARSRRGGLPPMPWGALKAMSDKDQRAVYRYLRHLGAGGEAAPAALPPGAPIPTPHFVFVPQPPTTMTLGQAAR